jgi:hypothetical protein
MVHSRKKTVRRLAFPAVVLGASLASTGWLSSSAQASSAVTKTSHYSLACSLGLFGNATFPGSHVIATYPASVKHGTKFSTTFAATTVIPTSYSSKAYAVGGRAYSANVHTYDVTVTGASPTTYNAAPMTIPKTPLYKNKPIILPTPIKGVITVHLVAGSPGTAHVTLGTNDTTATVYNSHGFGFLTITATCSPPSPPPDLGTIKIT